MMDDQQIINRGGTEEDIKNYAEQNGANILWWEIKLEDIIKEYRGNATKEDGLRLYIHIHRLIQDILDNYYER